MLWVFHVNRAIGRYPLPCEAQMSKWGTEGLKTLIIWQITSEAGIRNNWTGNSWTVCRPGCVLWTMEPNEDRGYVRISCRPLQLAGSKSFKSGAAEQAGPAHQSVHCEKETLKFCVFLKGKWVKPPNVTSECAKHVGSGSPWLCSPWLCNSCWVLTSHLLALESRKDWGVQKPSLVFSLPKSHGKAWMRGLGKPWEVLSFLTLGMSIKTRKGPVDIFLQLYYITAERATKATGDMSSSVTTWVTAQSRPSIAALTVWSL